MDIKQLEQETGISVTDTLKTYNIWGLINLIAINSKKSLEEAGNDLDDFLKDHTMSEAFDIIIDKLFPKLDSSDSTHEKIDTSKYLNLSDIYANQQSIVMKFGMSYGEFWNSTITDIVSLQKFMIEKIKQDQEEENLRQRSQAILNASAYWGKLPPLENNNPVQQVKDNLEDDTIVYTELGETTIGVFNLQNRLRVQAGIDPLLIIDKPEQ